MKKICFLFLCLLNFSLNAMDIRAYFSKNQIEKGEEVELIFSSNEPIQGKPEIAPLLSYFSILDQQTSYSSIFINGISSSSYELIFRLLPKIEGEIKLEGLKLNSTTLPVLNITVYPEIKKEILKEKNSPDNKTSLVSELVENEIYLGNSTVYIAQLQGIENIAQGEIYPPYIKGASITKIGEQKRKLIKKENNETKEVMEWRFLITPETTGELQISPVSFTGDAFYKDRNFKGPFADFFMDNSLKPYKRVSFISEKNILMVKEKPENWSSWWLPSSEVKMIEQFDLPKKIIKQGDVITRKITLTTKDLDASKIPLIEQTDNNQIKVYSEQPQRTNFIDQNSLVGKAEFSFSIVPLKEGKINIPSISLDWFNIKTGKKEKLELPEKEIFVEKRETLLKKEEPKENEQKIEGKNNHGNSPIIKTEKSLFIFFVVFLLISITIGLILGIKKLKKIKKNNKNSKLPKLYPYE